MEPQANYKIFLSHAGEQSGVADFLYIELQKSYDDDEIFFDKKSLKPGDSINPGIFNILGGIAVGVVVVSQDFVRKKWPMIELQYLIEAKENRDKDHFPLTIIPIFCDLEPGQLTDKAFMEELRNVYWNSMQDSNNNTREINLPFNIQKWKAALEKLKDIAGYCSLKQGPTMYMELRDKLEPVVSRICETYPPPVYSFSKNLERYYVGCERMAEEIHEQLENSRGYPNEQSEKGVITLGIHGVAGSGKSTISRTMVDFYKMRYKNLHSRSYYLELPSKKNDVEGMLVNLKAALEDVTSASNHLLKQIRHIHEAIGELQKRIKKFKVFLSIDNVRDWSKEYVQDILSAMCPGSTVMVTSRSRDILEYLNLNRIRCVPIMNENEAWKAFLGYLNLPSSLHDSNCINNSKCISNQLYSFIDGCHPKLLIKTANSLERTDEMMFSENIRDLVESSTFEELIQDVVLSAFNINDQDVHKHNELMQEILPSMNILLPVISDANVDNVQQYNCICTWSPLTQKEQLQPETLQELYMSTISVSDQVDDHQHDIYKILVPESENGTVTRHVNVDIILNEQFHIFAKCCEKVGNVWGIHGASHEVHSQFRKVKKKESRKVMRFKTSLKCMDDGTLASANTICS